MGNAYIIYVIMHSWIIAVITVSVNSRFHYTISWMIQFDPIRSDRKNEAMNYICNYGEWIIYVITISWMIQSWMRYVCPVCSRVITGITDKFQSFVIDRLRGRNMKSLLALWLRGRNMKKMVRPKCHPSLFISSFVNPSLKPTFRSISLSGTRGRLRSTPLKGRSVAGFESPVPYLLTLSSG